MEMYPKDMDRDTNWNGIWFVGSKFLAMRFLSNARYMVGAADPTIQTGLRQCRSRASA